tara:strand:- start:499 stop:1005 length:507 start_codon:yes stop_codon:yes gene_type:complete
MSTILRVVYTDSTTGEIQQSIISQPVNPPEGILSSDNSICIVHIMSDWTFPSGYSEWAHWGEDYYRDIQNEAWVYRGPRPNKASSWDGNNWVTNQTNWMTYIRYLRTQKLSASDWTQVADVNLTTAQKDAAASYRAELRNLPAVISANPSAYNTEDTIPWPTAPDFLA